jgi:hypothetical protein
MDELREEDLLLDAERWLQQALPPNWSASFQQANGPGGPDLIIQSQRGGGQGSILVEVKRRFGPRDVELLVGGPLWRRLRERAGQAPIMVITEYLSPRTRELLTQEGLSYLDLTGNARIVLDHPGLFVETQGASRDPNAAPPARGLKGSKVGAIVRVLTDAMPPYTGAEIADLARADQGYTSRILDTLLDDGLIDRPGRGPVVDVDWPSLIRRRADEVRLFKANSTYLYVARAGVQSVLQSLSKWVGRTDRGPVVTGSFAAARIALVAPPGQLVVYTLDRDQLATNLDLLEVESGADTVLIRPQNRVPFYGVKTFDGLPFAAPSQVAIDCLSGPGRMPEEGAALIAWMIDNEPQWRASSVRQLRPSWDRP